MNSLKKKGEEEEINYYLMMEKGAELLQELNENKFFHFQFSLLQTLIENFPTKSSVEKAAQTEESASKSESNEAEITKIIKNIIKKCGQLKNEEEFEKFIEKFIENIKSAEEEKRKYQIEIFQGMFEKIEENEKELIKKIVIKFYELEKNLKKKNQTEINGIYMSALEKLEIDEFLEIISVDLFNDNEKSGENKKIERIFYLLKQSNLNSSFEYFKNKILPKIQEISEEIEKIQEKIANMEENSKKKKKSEEKEKKQFLELKKQIKSKKHKILKYWELFIGIAGYAKDVQSNFSKMAPLLGKQLTASKKLSKTICQGLNNLIWVNYKTANPSARCIIHHFNEEFPVNTERVSVERATDNLAEIAKFSKNFLPILFNLFSNFNKKEKKTDFPQICLRLIANFLSICPIQVPLPFYWLFSFFIYVFFRDLGELDVCRWWMVSVLI